MSYRYSTLVLIIAMILAVILIIGGIMFCGLCFLWRRQNTTFRKLKHRKTMEMKDIQQDNYEEITDADLKNACVIEKESATKQPLIPGTKTSGGSVDSATKHSIESSSSVKISGGSEEHGASSSSSGHVTSVHAEKNQKPVVPEDVVEEDEYTTIQDMDYEDINNSSPPKQSNTASVCARGTTEQRSGKFSQEFSVPELRDRSQSLNTDKRKGSRPFPLPALPLVPVPPKGSGGQNMYTAVKKTHSPSSNSSRPQAQESHVTCAYENPQSTLENEISENEMGSDSPQDNYSHFIRNELVKSVDGTSFDYYDFNTSSTRAHLKVRHCLSSDSSERSPKRHHFRQLVELPTRPESIEESASGEGTSDETQEDHIYEGYDVNTENTGNDKSKEPCSVYICEETLREIEREKNCTYKDDKEDKEVNNTNDEVKEKSDNISGNVDSSQILKLKHESVALDEQRDTIRPLEYGDVKDGETISNNSTKNQTKESVLRIEEYKDPNLEIKHDSLASGEQVLPSVDTEISVEYTTKL